uniref:RING-type domain-containing protein n=1 Tax=Cynoglossus semilaevis TaxID=244447 RepID=A0A3P8W6S4_CYNSE
MHLVSGLIHLKATCTCPVCRDLFTEPVVIQCGHSFCESCITHWWDLSGQRSCPRLCGRFFSALMKVGDHGLIDTTSAPVWSRGNCFPSLHSPRYISNSISLSLEEAGGENVSL